MTPRRSPLAALLLFATAPLTACSEQAARTQLGADAQVADAQVALPFDAAVPDAGPYWELDAAPSDGGLVYDGFVPVLDAPACDRDAGPCAPTALAARGSATCSAWAGGESTCWGGFALDRTVTMSRGRVVPAQLAVTSTGALSISQYGELWALTGAVPVRVGVGTGFRALASAGERACVLREDGAPSCFAVDVDGLPSRAPDGNPDDAGVGLSLTRIATTTALTCGLDGAGALVCWGEEQDGSLGGKGPLATPTQIHAGPFDDLALAPGATCVRSAAGALACWGTRYGGGPSDAEPTPLALPGPAGDFDLGARHGCAVVAERVYCWGDGSDGQLGRTPLSVSTTPLEVPDVQGALYVATGDLHSCAATRAGQVYCWGSNVRGAVLGSTSSRSLPTAPRGFDGTATYRDVAIAANGGCLVESSGELACWGQCHPDGASNDLAPRRVESGGSFTQVVVEDMLGCGLDGSGALYCWGSHPFLLPAKADGAVRVQPGSTFQEIALGHDTLCAITGAQALVCWGANASDLLGGGSTAPVSTAPVPVLAARTFTHVAVGELSAAAIDSSGRVYQWGARGDGTGNTAPTQVTLPAAASAIAAGQGYVCALDTGGALYCWGYGSTALDAGATTSPTRLGSGPYRALSARLNHACVLDAEGHAQCFGPGSLLRSTRPSASANAVSFARVRLHDSVLAGLDAAGHLFLSFGSAALNRGPARDFGFEIATPTPRP